MHSCTISYVNRGGSRVDRGFDNAQAFVDRSGALSVVGFAGEERNYDQGVKYCRAPGQWISFKNMHTPEAEEADETSGQAAQDTLNQEALAEA